MWSVPLGEMRTAQGGDSTWQQCERGEGTKGLSPFNLGTKLPWKGRDSHPKENSEYCGAVVPRGFILIQNKSFPFSVFFFNLPCCVFSAQSFQSVVKGWELHLWDGCSFEILALKVQGLRSRKKIPHFMFGEHQALPDSGIRSWRVWIT